MNMISRSLIVAAAVLALTACERRAEVSSHAGTDFQVDRLFTHEGCTVYRFEDGGRNRYYANCSGKATTSWAENCGKNCTTEVMITTN